jgi:Protein of unknown function (DUF3667)
VSHLKQRKEKACLNCNAAINGRYCSICGQENLEPQESVWHLITHTFNDITHFDGKFFYSLRYLIKKPGFLTSEYMAGRRVSYLNPIRFYIFTSFIFFFIIFTFFVKKGEDSVINISEGSTKDSAKLVNKYKNAGIDSLLVDSLIKKSGIDSLNFLLKDKLLKDNQFSFFHPYSYRNRKEFDSLDKMKQIDENFFNRILINKQFVIQEKYGDDAEKGKEAVFEAITHLVPQILLISLPFFALLLKILYIRRKNFYYVTHIIFTIHFYVFLYIEVLLIYISAAISHLNGFRSMRIVTAFLIFGIFFYAYKAMRNFYEQSRWKTVLKYILLFFALFFLLFFLMMLLLGLTIFKL